MDRWDEIRELIEGNVSCYATARLSAKQISLKKETIFFSKKKKKKKEEQVPVY